MGKVRKSLRDIALELRIEVIEKDEKRLLKRSPSDMIVQKVYKRDLELYLNRGWAIVAHQESNYSRLESFSMVISRETLEVRYASA